MIRSFILGAITGGAIVWIWGREIREFIDDRTRNVRARMAESLDAAAGGLEAAKETLEAGLSGSSTARRGIV